MLVAKQLNNNENRAMDPVKFNLWLGIIGTTMFFAALTSAYIVKRAEGNWNDFIIPQQFIYSCIIVILSSISMQWAYFSAKRDNLANTKTALITTMILGVGFGISQFMGWNILMENNMYFAFNDDVSVSFFYVITAFHFLHVFGGWIALSRTTWKAFKLKVHKTSMRTISMCTTYWHFMGVLWIYLFLFLFLNR